MAGYSVTYTVVDEATREIERINREIRRMREPMERQSRAIQQFIEVSGLKKVSEGFREITRTTREAFESMVRIVPVMGTLTGAASLAGLAELVKGFTEFSRAIDLTATRTGSTTDEIQDLAVATELAGGDTADMTESLKGLTDQIYKARIGDAEAAAWFRKANISIVDANGNLRKATEVLPEVIAYLEKIPNPAERMRVAIGLGSQNLALLAEQFERSGRTMPEWLREAQKFTKLSEDQIEANRRYEQSIGALTAAFTSLRNQVGAVLSEALAPLIKEFAAWVQVHQPQIVAAVRELVRAFADWIKGIDWKSVGDGAKSIAAVLLGIARNFDTIKQAAIGLALVLGASSPLGLALEAIALTSLAIYQNWDKIKKVITETVDWAVKKFHEMTKALDDLLARFTRLLPGAPPAAPPGGGVAERGFGGGPTPWHRPAAPAPAPAMPGRQGAVAPIGRMGPGYAAKAATLIPALMRDLNLTRDQAAGLVGNLGFESHGFGVYHEQGLPESAGGVGWAQWTGRRRREFEAWAAANNLDPHSDAANYGFLVHELQTSQSGFLADLRRTGSVAGATQTTERKYEAPRDPAASYLARLSLANQAQGAPVQLATGTPATGSVNVTVTHRNPPAGSSIAAAGTGDVNVAPPRVEYSQLAVI